MCRSPFLPALALACAALLHAQPTAPDLTGDWAATLGSGAASLHLTLHVTRTFDGLYTGQLVSVDQGGAQIPLGKATLQGRSVTLEFPLVSGSFKGDLSADGSTLTGNWTQGAPQPLTFTRNGKAPAEPAKEAAPPAPSRAAVDVLVPAPPIPFRGAGGQSHLIYELHITNFSPQELRLTRIEVLGDRGSMASFEGPALLDVLMRVGSKTDDARQIGLGFRTVAFLTVPLPDGAAPARLHHRLSFDGSTLDLAPVALRAPSPIVIGPPLAGSDWLVGNGPGNRSLHRRALMAVGGRAVIAQRFAIDWLQLKTADSTFTGDAKINKNYKAYGADVLAVADATVSLVKDGIPENIPGEDSRAVPINLETAAGNHIILDLGGGNYCMYAHLQPGSLKVKAGDKVKRGQPLAFLGNSGNSTEPHLHFQVMDGPSPLGAEGLPYLIDSFELLSGRNAGKKTNALPMENMRIKW